MYLKRLYHYHKGWFAFIVLFVAAELFICYKRGVVLTPFLQYGMYSAVQLPQDSMLVPEILVDGRPLEAAAFNGATWDKVVAPLDIFRREQAWNKEIWEQNISRMLHLRDPAPYLNRPVSAAEFMAWYKAYLPAVIHRRIDTLSIRYIVLHWKNP